MFHMSSLHAIDVHEREAQVFRDKGPNHMVVIVLLSQLF